MLRLLRRMLGRVRFCRSPRGLPAGTILFFPVDPGRLCCGLAGIVELVRAAPEPVPEPAPVEALVEGMARAGIADLEGGVEAYAGGEETLRAVEGLVAGLRRPEVFPAVFRDDGLRERLAALARRIAAFVREEEGILEAGRDLPDLAVQEEVNRRLTRLRDAAWAVEREMLGNVERVRALLGPSAPGAGDKLLRELRKANLVLNAIDRMEIRGRDSAGILFQVRRPEGAVETLVYKVAAEVGKLGDNVAALRSRIAADGGLLGLLADPGSRVLVTAHTRWASNGIINVPNCHPLDSRCADEEEPPPLRPGGPPPRLHIALNGDIDNYIDLKRRFEEETGRKVPDRVTTDAKIIALWVDRHLRQGHELAEAFRLAVRDFEGSASILLTSDLEPGRLYLSLKGSGQSLYVGLAASGYVVASEIYGLVEETSRFLKLEGERERVPGDETTRGQIYVLDLGKAGLAGVRALHHDGVEIGLGEAAVRTAEITTRDVDRGDHPHYFLKEVSQAPGSVARTLRGKFTPEGRSRMGEETVSPALDALLRERSLERIVVVGQGTAAVAATAAAAFIGDALAGSGIAVESMKASELSGFGLRPDMSRMLVVAVTQSGATADTNRAVDLARERGARTLAIVNRRNSDITFKTAGVLYTSDGRDVEMSVASTKAFYSQVVAGALLGLDLALRAGTRTEAQAGRALADLGALPDLMKEVFGLRDRIASVAERFAPTRRYWTVVGSGPNRIAAEEVRIKLSELCYKSISADSVEDKKHIDLSSESMILVLAPGHDAAVLGDLAKDVAIFRAHRAIPVVFATRGERRFDAYAAAVVELPPAPPLSSMVLATMAGHLFGYAAARAIDEGGRFLGRLRSVVVGALDLGRIAPPEEMRRLEREYRERLRADRFASALEAGTAADLGVLLRYASGGILAAGFPQDFGRPSPEIPACLVETLVRAVDQTTRPVDAIKHQAKIVTVGTSRLTERPTGVLFDALAEAGVPFSAITFADRARIEEVQVAIRRVNGMTRYAVEGLTPAGEPDGDARIRVLERTGSAAAIPSRAEQPAPLKGTKRAVVRDRRAFVGVGAKDQRRIAILPLVDHRFAVTALVLLHLEFHGQIDLAGKLRALGERYEEIVNGVTEADIPWTDDYIERLTPEELVTTPPAHLAERIVRGRRVR